MICAKCNYVMSDFDVECPRCHGKGLPDAKEPESSKSVVSTHTLTSDWLPGQQPNANNVPAPTPSATIPARSVEPRVQIASVAHPQTIAQPAPSPVIHPASYRCPRCGNESVQAVSAIVSAGSWHEDTSWTETTQTRSHSNGVGYGVVLGDRHPASVISVSGAGTTGKNKTNGHGSTAGCSRLAEMLTPPEQPAPPARQGAHDFNEKRFGGCVVACFVILGAYSNGDIGIWGVLFWGCIVLLFVKGAMPSDGFIPPEAQAAYNADRQRWSEQMAVWQRLSYCSRCDHVFDPQTSKAARPQSMSVLM